MVDLPVAGTLKIQSGSARRASEASQGAVTTDDMEVSMKLVNAVLGAVLLAAATFAYAGCPLCW